MNRIRLLGRAIGWRSASSLGFLVVATFAVLTAAAGPLYLGAADGATLRSTLTAAGPAGVDVNASAPVTAPASAEQAEAALSLGANAGLEHWFGRGVWTVLVTANVPAKLNLVSRPGVCSHLVFIVGRCPSQAGQIVLTIRSARAMGVHLGSTVHPSAPPGLGQLQVVGIVRAGNPEAAYWLGDDFFGYQAGSPPSHLDSGFTLPATISGLPAVASVQYPLKVDSLRVRALGPMESALSHFNATATQSLGLVVTTGLYSQLDSYNQQITLMAASVALVGLQLLLLCLFLLQALAARSAQARRREVAIAKLRGFRTRGVLAVGLLEPLALLGLAVPSGVVLGLVVVTSASALLLQGEPVIFLRLAIATGLVAALGGVAMVVVGSWRGLTSRPADELRGVPMKPSAEARAAWDGVTLALAAAGLLELATTGVLNSGEPNPLALLTPGLLALAVAVIGVRVLPLCYHPFMRGVPRSRGLAGALALRQVSRRPAALRQAVVLTVGIALVFFAVSAFWVAAGNRVLRADFQVGAARVLTVGVPSGVDLVTAVRAADPSGRYAMAAEESRANGQSLLAVDPSRLQKVAYWAPGLSSASLGQIAHWLSPKLTPALTVQGSQVRIETSVTAPENPSLDLQLQLIDNGGNSAVADFGYLAAGAGTYVAALPAVCRRGCRATALTPFWVPGSSPLQSVEYSLRLTGIQDRVGSGAWQTPAGPVLSPSDWRGSPGALVGGSVGSVDFSFTDTTQDTSPPQVVPAPLPAVLPAVATTASRGRDPAATSVEDFDGTELTLDTRLETTALPNLGQQGILISLPLALRAEQSSPVETTDYVWLAPDAPERVIRTLRKEGLSIEGTVTPGPTLYAYNHGGLALAFDFFLLAAGAAALLAVTSSFLQLTQEARGRKFELATMRAVGIPQRTLRRSLLAEQLLVVAPGAAAGIVVGLVGATIALPSTPEFVSNVGSPPLELSLPLFPLAILAAATLLVLVAASSLAAILVVNDSGFDRLRMDVR